MIARCLLVASAALALIAPAAAQEDIVQEDITTTHADLQGDLAGTLEGTLAKGTPAVLIVPGSGPIDRDGNSPLGISAQSYKLLTDALAQRGIASVRIDKRGMFASKAAVDIITGQIQFGVGIPGENDLFRSWITGKVHRGDRSS